MSACRHHLDSRAAPMQVSLYSGRLAARFCSSSKESSLRAVGSLVTSRSGVTRRGIPSTLPILGHALMIASRSRIADGVAGVRLICCERNRTSLKFFVKLAFAMVTRYLATQNTTMCGYVNGPNLTKRDLTYASFGRRLSKKSRAAKGGRSLPIQRLEGSRPVYAFSIVFARRTEGVRAADGRMEKDGNSLWSGSWGDFSYR